jgi:hypothetical protein
MRKAISATAVAAFGSLALAGSAFAAEDWSTHSVAQQSIVKVFAANGGTPKGNKPILLDSYLSTRDPNSPKAASQPQAVGSVDITFPKGSKVNNITKPCKMYATTKPWDLARLCSAAKVGEGWALVSGLGTSALPRIPTPAVGTAPTSTGNYAAAPADCLQGDATQYSRTYEAGTSLANPLAGLSCTPAGFTWVHVTGYAGVGNGNWNAATGKVYDRTDAAKKRSAKVTDKKAIIFANDNGVAAISFAGTVKPNADRTLTLHVDLPAFNAAGLKGFLPLDSDLVDFRFATTNPKYLTAGPCPSTKKYTITSVFKYSPFPGDYATGNTSAYPDQTVSTVGSCIK